MHLIRKIVQLGEYQLLRALLFARPQHNQPVMKYSVLNYFYFLRDSSEIHVVGDCHDILENSEMIRCSMDEKYFYHSLLDAEELV